MSQQGEDDHSEGDGDREFHHEELEQHHAGM
jgi:hypothetical protein